MDALLIKVTTALQSLVYSVYFAAVVVLTTASVYQKIPHVLFYDWVESDTHTHTH